MCCLIFFLNKLTGGTQNPHRHVAHAMGLCTAPAHDIMNFLLRDFSVYIVSFNFPLIAHHNVRPSVGHTCACVRACACRAVCVCVD